MVDIQLIKSILELIYNEKYFSIILFLITILYTHVKYKKDMNVLKDIIPIKELLMNNINKEIINQQLIGLKLDNERKKYELDKLRITNI